MYAGLLRSERKLKTVVLAIQTYSMTGCIGDTRHAAGDLMNERAREKIENDRKILEKRVW